MTERKKDKQLPVRAALTELTIEEVLTRWPETAVIFHQHNMACVGCAVASFYTVTEAANVYGVSSDHFLDELVAVIDRPVDPS